MRTQKTHSFSRHMLFAFLYWYAQVTWSQEMLLTRSCLPVAVLSYSCFLLFLFVTLISYEHLTNVSAYGTVAIEVVVISA